MTTARATAALLLIAAAVGAIALLLMPSPAAHADTHPRPAEAVSRSLAATATPRGTGVGADLDVLAAAAPGSELSPAQADEALLAADRVCEGITAGVPEGFMIRTVADESGLPLPQAHLFVEAAAVRCGAAL